MPLSPSPGGGSSSNSRAASAARKVYARIKYGEEDPSRFVVLLQDEEVLFTALLEMEEAGSAVPFHFIRSIRDCTDGSEIFALQSQSPSNPATPPLAARPPRPPPVDQDAPPAAVELPDVLWHIVMRHLNTRDLCYLARVSKALRRAVSASAVWRFRFEALLGVSPARDLDAANLRRICRRSELRAARWLDAECVTSSLGFAAACLALDSTKAACGERDCLRVYGAPGGDDSGRKLGTLRGHGADVTCVASSDSLLLSGDGGGSLRLWSVDDFKPVRTLRGHTGTVADCLLLRDGPPVSACSDGTVKIWDSTQAAAVATIECDTAITSLAVDVAAAGCPSVLYAGGGFIECLDVASATRTLTLIDLLDETCEAGVLPVSRLSVQGSLLAAGGVGGMVSLWDVRAARLVACLQAGTGACGGLQLDDWKLVAAFDDDCVVVHDIRAVAATGRFQPEPLLSLPTEGRVTALRFCGGVLLAAVEGRPCVSWSFEAPSTTAQAWPESPDADAEAGRAERRKKGGVPKVRGRYAKRTTR